MGLTSAAVGAVGTEAAVFALLNEWLAGWFDGQAHAIGAGAAPVVFPRVNRSFGQGAPQQPLYDLGEGVASEIRVVVHPRQETAAPMAPGRSLMTQQVLLNFWVSAKRPGKGQSERLAQSVGDLLHALLVNPDARYALAEKGITHLAPAPAEWLPSADYATRLVACGAAVQYGMEYGGEG